RPASSSLQRFLRRALPAALVAICCLSSFGVERAHAQAQQFLDFRTQVRPAKPSGSSGLAQQATKGSLAQSDSKMLVRADEMTYDNNAHTVSAVGNVQIYYSGATLQANKVIYNQETKRLHAEGNVQMTES